MKPVKKAPSKADALQSSRPPNTPPNAAGAKPGSRPVTRPPGKPGAKPTGKGTLIKTPKKGGIQIPPVPILIGVIFGLIIIMFMVYMLWPSPKADVAVVAEGIEPREQVEEFPVDQASIYPPDSFLSSPTPLQELARQTTEKALREHQGYIVGQGLYLADGTLLSESTSELIVLRDTATNDTLLQLQGMTQTQVDPATGRSVILVRDEVTGGMTPIGVATQASALENQAYRMASSNIELQMAALLNRGNSTDQLVANSQQPQVQTVIEKQIVVETVIDDTEKRKYVSLIEAQERENAKLREKMNNIRDDMASQRKQVVDIVQRIEDSPSANQRLRASMLPAASGLKQQAIVGDRVWFEDKEGNLSTYRIGEVIDGTNLLISGTDEGSGVVLVTGK